MQRSGIEEQGLGIRDWGLGTRGQGGEEVTSQCSGGCEVSHVSKGGRHGAPEIVSWLRKTGGGRVWSPMSPKPGDMGHPGL